MLADRTTSAKLFLATILKDESLESLAPTGTSAESVMRVLPQASRRDAAEMLGPDRDALQRATEAAAKKLITGAALTPLEQFATEAIIIPDKRPAIDIIDGDYNVVHPLWLRLNDEPIKLKLRKSFPSIGRIELPHHPSLPYGGTGFVVGHDLLMTNRHVAEIFSSGLGVRQLVFRQGLEAGIDFAREKNSPPLGQVIAVRSVVMIHPYWDMALLRVEGLDMSHAPLTLSLQPPEDLLDRDIVVVGYPALDPRNPLDVQNQVFGGVYYVKRLQPGKLNGRGQIESFDKIVAAVTHDSSTLGGNSGSAVIDVESGQVVGLHFAGLYLKSNYAVPTAELARDAHVDEMLLNFEDTPRTEPGIWQRWWDATAAAPETRTAPPADAAADADADRGVPSPPPATQPRITVRPPTAAGLAAGDTASWTIPLEITVRIGGATAADRTAAAAPLAVPSEALVEPTHDEDYASREGYDPYFLGVEAPLPSAIDPLSVVRLSDDRAVVPYHHFSIALHKARRLALFTAANLDLSVPMRAHGGTRRELSGLADHDMEKWFIDPRVPAIYQLPDRFFTKDKGAFDKGHIVRREDVAWGPSFEVIQRANGDTYHVTNCSPQVKGFNRPERATNWGDLEQYVSKQANKGRLSLFAGPVLALDDPTFVGVDDGGAIRVQIPRRYWKVVLAAEQGALQAFAFALEQDLGDTPLEFAVDAKWQAFMVSIAELEAMTRLVRFPQAIHDADQAGQPAGEALRSTRRIRRRAWLPGESVPPGAASAAKAAAAPPARGAEALAQGPITFRDHFLSLYQSIAAEVARGQSGTSATEAVMLGEPGESAAAVLLAAERVAQARFYGLAEPSMAESGDGGGAVEMPLAEQAATCASLAFQLLEAKVLGDTAKAARLEEELKGGSCDPKWATTVTEYLRYFGPSGARAQPIYVTPTEAGDSVIQIKARSRVALIGDWGTGAEPARRLLRQVRDQEPDALVHLGDIYYSGTERECHEHFEAIIEEVFGPVTTRIPIFTLAGNHDMYCGGVGYYGLIQRLNSEPFRQRASFFCLRADDASWQLIAMDTGRHDYNPLSVVDAVTFVEPAEEEWLRARVAECDGITILLSHHQLFSAFSPIGKVGTSRLRNPCNARLVATYEMLRATGKPIPAWFWGHEHNLCIYGPYANLTRGRCLGSSAIPVFAKDEPYKILDNLLESPAIKDETQLSIVDGYYTHSFATLTFSLGGHVTADYFEDLNGKSSKLYTETF